MNDGRPVAGATATVAAWTLVSRVTGLVRVAAVGATLGPTFFANIFQATNTVPNVMYNVMAGSLLVSALVPSLVDAIDREGLEGAQRRCRALLGAITVGFGVVAGVVVLLSPVLVHLITLGTRSTAQASEARAVAWVLLLLVVPQVVLYGVAAVGAAAQNARGRFALAAAAPAAENIGLVVTLVLVARWFGTGNELGAVPAGQLAVLGVGSTLSVMLHAALQALGAQRVGLVLLPSAQWRDAAVRDVLRRIVPMAATAMLEAATFFAMVVAAGTVAGGVVAVQIGVQCYNLPLALGARAIGTVLLPGLSREAAPSRRDRFDKAYADGLAQAWFLAVPASMALIVFARPLADAVAVGRLDESGVALVAVAIASFGTAVVGGATFEIARQASYARFDVRAPALAGAAQLAVVLVGAAVGAAAFGGRATVFLIGTGFAVGSVVRAIMVHRAVRGGMAHGAGVAGAFGRHLLMSVIAVLPAGALAHAIATVVDGRAGAIGGLVAGSAVGLLAYLALQVAVRAPELAFVPQRSSATPRPTAESSAA